MRVDVHFTPAHTDELQLRDKNLIVIDVLRAGTTIATALANGAKEVIPVETVEAAVRIAGSLSGDVVLLGGERNGKMIEGFHLGNSPAEYTESVVKGKSIVYTTTNGSVAMARGRHAKNLAVASFVNVGRVIEFMKSVGENFVIICAGNQSASGWFSLEDAVCAGMIVDRLQERGSQNLELSDSAVAAHALYRNFGRNILTMMENSEAGKYLSEIGLKDDLTICAAVDSIPVLPLARGNVVKLEPEPERGG